MNKFKRALVAFWQDTRGGAMIGGLLSSLMGQQGNQSTTSNSTTSGNQSTNQSGQQTTNPNEDPLFTQFRQTILPALAQQFQQAQQPVYGDAQVAKVAQTNNDAANAAQTSVSNNAARRGTLNSGATDAASTAIQQASTGKTADFMNSLPFLNQQAQWGKTQDLLGLATNFLGRSPLGQTSTSNNQGNSTFGQTTDASSKTKSSSAPSLFRIPLG